MDSLPTALHPLPPGYYCVPSALLLLTGEDPVSVVIPAINRHSRSEDLLEAPAGVAIRRIAEPVLREMGYACRQYKHDDLECKLLSWAKRSLRWPGRPLLVTTKGETARRTPGHCLVVCDGRIYDNWCPLGADATAHPFAHATVDYAALVQNTKTVAK